MTLSAEAIRFDSAELEHAAAPRARRRARHCRSTPWPKLASARRLHRVGEAREPYPDGRVQGARRSGLSRSAARDPIRKRAWSHHGHPRQPWPVDRLRRRARRRGGDHLRAPRQLARSELRHPAVSARGWCEFGRDFDEAKHEAFRVAERGGTAFRAVVPPRISSPGVATYALELFRAVAALDAVYVGVGMGSGISGLIVGARSVGARTEIIAVGAARPRPPRARSRPGAARRALRHDLCGWTRDPRAARATRSRPLPRRGAHGGGDARMRSPRRCASTSTTRIRSPRVRAPRR